VRTSCSAPAPTLLLLLAAAALTLPSVSLAQDYNLCVVSDASAPSEGCGAPCDAGHGLLTSISAAVAVIPGLPNLASGPRPSVRICVTGPEFHHEQVTVTRSGLLEPRGLTLETDGTTLCSDGAVPGAPLISWETSSDPFFAGDRISVRMDLRSGGDCAFTGPGIHAWGGERLFIEDTTILGSSGFAILANLDGFSPIALDLQDTHIIGCQGAAIIAGLGVSMLRTEIVGCQLRPLGPEEPTALLLAEGYDGFRIASSALFGNLIDGAGIVADNLYPALIAGPIARIERSLLAANVLTTGAALVRTPIPRAAVDHIPGGPMQSAEGHWLSGSVISRNRHVLSLDSQVPEEAEPALWRSADEESLPSCAGLDQLAPYRDRSSPAASAQDSSGPLFEFLQGNSGADVGLSVSHSFFVANRTGAGPLLRMDTAGERLDVQLLQNTFADNGAARLLELAQGQPSSSIVAARNLFAPSDGIPAAEPLLLFADPPTSLTVTMNAAPEPVVWFDDDGAASHALVGPNPNFGAHTFVELATLTSMDECQRFKAVCPSMAQVDCAELPWLDLPCAVDAAIQWLPSAELAAALGEPWPWQTTFFELGAEAGALAPGATGGNCAAIRLAFDSFIDQGDGDGYPDIVDCDNDVWETQPAVPIDDGYSVPYCDATHAPCYLCPAGTTPRPETDPGPGPMPSEDPSADSYLLVEPGCYRAGCAVSYDCSSGNQVSGALLLLLPLGLRRRR